MDKMDVSDVSREWNFIQQMRMLREARGLTQTDIARAMKKRGFAFHQQTIQRIESGERPVRLDEAYTIAAVLGETVESMTADDELRAAEVELEFALAESMNAQRAAADAAADAERWDAAVEDRRATVAKLRARMEDAG